MEPNQEEQIRQLYQDQFAKQYAEHQKLYREQLELSAELGNIQNRLHCIIENLLDRNFLNRKGAHQLFKTFDPPLASLIFDLQKFVFVHGNMYGAPEIELADEPE